MIGLEQPSNIEVAIFNILDLKILDHFILLNYIVLSRQTITQHQFVLIITTSPQQILHQWDLHLWKVFILINYLLQVSEGAFSKFATWCVFLPPLEHLPSIINQQNDHFNLHSKFSNQDSIKHVLQSSLILHSQIFQSNV